MNDDLISRSALKKAIESWKEKDEYYHRVKFGYIPFSEVYDLIDNAPTVCNDNYSMGYQDGVKKVLSERPQGKWIRSSNMSKKSYQRVCDQCHHISYFCGDGNYPNCPYCLADMREADDD